MNKIASQDSDLCKATESALAESEERFRQMAEMTGEWLWEQDPYGYYIYSSIAVKQILGLSPDEVLGKHYTEFLTTQDKAHQQDFADIHQPFYGLINYHRHKDGHLVFTESTGLPIMDKQGTLIKWRGIDRDITAKKNAEQQIREAQIALAVSQNEISIAQKIQASLLPSAPIAHADFEITGICLPADRIGGDYFDYFFRDEKCLDMVIADVSGHSIGPALFMVEARSVIRTHASRPGTPSETLNLLNSFLFDDLDKADYFITLFYLQYDIGTRQARFANAGHPHPLLFKAKQNECIQLDAEGLILGVNKSELFAEQTLSLDKGDVILLYTDGIIEAENIQGEFFGIERVIGIFSQQAQSTPQEIITALLEGLRQFCQQQVFSDDITLMLFKCC